MINTAFHLYYAPSAFGMPNSAVLDNAAKYDKAWLVAGAEVLPDQVHYSGVSDYTQYLSIAQSLRERNPKIKIGWYVGGAASPGVHDPAYVWAEGPFSLHTPAGVPITAMTGLLSYRFMNIGNGSVAEYFASKWIEWLNAMQADGLIIDSFEPEWYALMCGKTVAEGGWLGLSNGAAEGPIHTPEYWQDALASYGSKLRWRLSQHGFETMGVAVSPYDPDGTPLSLWRGQDYTNIALKYNSGAFCETVYYAYIDPTYFDKLVRMSQTITNAHKNLFFSVTPRMGEIYAGATVPDNASTRLFFQALYYLIQEPPYTTYGYHPYYPYRGWDDNWQPYTMWDTNWEWDLGIPVGPAAQYTGNLGSLWYRSYSKALVVVNHTKSYRQFSYGGRWHLNSPTGPILDMTNAGPWYLMNVPPQEAWILFPA